MYNFDWQQKASSQAQAETLARKILGVEEGASAEELKRAWRSKCKKHHPDRRPDDAEAEERFKLVREAYMCLRYGKRCQELLTKAADLLPAEEDDESAPSNQWAYFLSWRDRFF